MNSYTPYITILLILIGTFVLGQEIPDEEPTIFEVPPLEELIQSAMENSPLLNATQIEQTILREELNITRKEWMDRVNFDGAVNYGMYDQLLIRGLGDSDIDPLSQLSRGEQIRYYGGASLKIPLSTFTTRRNKMKINKLEIEKAEMQTLAHRQEIRRLIINAYFELLYLEESVKTHHEIYQTLQISYLKAERDVQQGRIQLAEFATIVSTVGKAKDEYLKVRSSYFSQYRLLGEITGLNHLNQ